MPEKHSLRIPPSPPVPDPTLFDRAVPHGGHLRGPAQRPTRVVEMESSLLAVAAGLGGFAVLYRSLLVAVVAAAYLTAAIALMVTNTIWAEETAYLSIGILSCALAIGALLAMSPESAHD